MASEPAAQRFCGSTVESITRKKRHEQNGAIDGASFRELFFIKLLSRYRDRRHITVLRVF